MALDFNPAYITPRADVASLVPHSARLILDVGCSDGSLGAILKNQMDCRIVGVEQNAKMVEAAQKRLDRVEQADLDEASLRDIFGDCKNGFDCIIFADILEHLKDPWNTLQDAVSLLSSEGKVVTSIPNIRHLTSLFSVGVMGRWPYRDRGIHDRTHLRFFTRNTILNMFASAHLEVLAERRHLRLLDYPHRLNKLAKVFDLPGLRPFFTYQYLHLSAAKKMSS